jgi:hypothetical protein
MLFSSSVRRHALSPIPFHRATDSIWRALLYFTTSIGEENTHRSATFFTHWHGKRIDSRFSANCAPFQHLLMNKL